MVDQLLIPYPSGTITQIFTKYTSQFWNKNLFHIKAEKKHILVKIKVYLQVLKTKVVHFNIEKSDIVAEYLHFPRVDPKICLSPQLGTSIERPGPLQEKLPSNPAE